MFSTRSGWVVYPRIFLLPVFLVKFYIDASPFFLSKRRMIDFLLLSRIATYLAQTFWCQVPTFIVFLFNWF